MYCVNNICRLITVVIVLLFFAMSFPAYAGPDQVGEKKTEWFGRLADGTKIDADQLNEIVRQHEKWLLSDGLEGKRANFKNADLRNVSLVEVNLSHAGMTKANLSNANLVKTNLKKAFLDGADLKNAALNWADLRNAYLLKASLKNAVLRNANLSNAVLIEVNLSNANLQWANLNDAVLGGANLTNASLKNADLSDAFILRADLTDANLFEANLKDIELKEVNLNNSSLWNVDKLPLFYEPKAGFPPYIPSVASVTNLKDLRFEKAPHGLIDLREGFKKYGYRKQEKEITFALKHTQTEKLLNEKDFLKRMEGYFNLCLFEKTCQWGLSPGLPLWILLSLIPVFSLMYLPALMNPDKHDGIWKAWNPDRVRKDLGKSEPELLTMLNAKAFLYGFYFSVLSAFNIGWREINVGNWISRIQTREYALKGTGWVRVVSGIQSLISVYLLALAILSYFGRPFESF